MSFNVLPVELAQFIFEKVDYSDLLRFATVSKEWNALVTPLIWRNITIKTRPHTTDLLLDGIKRRSIYITNILHTRQLTLDLRFQREIDDYPRLHQLEGWLLNFDFVEALITQERTPQLQYLVLYVSELDIGDSEKPPSKIQNVRKRIFQRIHNQLPRFVNDLSRQRDHLEVTLDYYDNQVQHPPPEHSKLLEFVFCLQDLTTATITSLGTGMKWPYGAPALRNLRHLTLVDRDWACGTQLQWTDFRCTQLETLVLHLFSLPQSLTFPDTLRTIKIYGTGKPVYVLTTSFYSLPSLRNLTLDQTETPFDFDDWHHAELLSLPLLAVNLRSLCFGDCSFNPDIIRRLARECPKLEQLRFLLNRQSSICRHVKERTKFSTLDDPPNGVYDYWYAFLKAFGDGIIHVLYTSGEMKVDSQSNDRNWWWTLRTSKRRSHVEEQVVVKSIPHKLELYYIGDEDDNIQARQELLKLEETNVDIIYWSFMQEEVDE